jgi:hypothetical protein
MRDAPPPSTRSVGEVIGAGVLTGVIAGFATGAIDAVWSWGPASQFVPGLSHVRFVLFSGFTYAAAGALLALAVTSGLLVLSRGSRLGELARFLLDQHTIRRTRDPGEAVVGLAFVLAAIPTIAVALWIAFRQVVPFVTNRKELGLVVIVAMAGALLAIAIAVAIAFVIARVLEIPLAKLARRWPPLASPLGPPIAAGALLGLAAAGWAATAWETARLLPLRIPIVLAVGLAMAIGAARPSLALAIRLGERRAGWPFRSCCSCWSWRVVDRRA